MSSDGVLLRLLEVLDVCGREEKGESSVWRKSSTEEAEFSFKRVKQGSRNSLERRKSTNARSEVMTSEETVMEVRKPFILKCLPTATLMVHSE